MASDKYIHYSDGLPNSKPKTSPPQSLLGNVPLGTKMVNKAVDTGINLAMKFAPKGTSIGINKGRPYIKTNTPGKG